MAKDTKNKSNDKGVKNRPAIEVVDRHPSSIKFDRPLEAVLFKTGNPKYYRLILKFNDGEETAETTLIMQKGAKVGIFGSTAAERESKEEALLCKISKYVVKGTKALKK